MILTVFFFFSSRRRHTRFDCDWSSDVCSSDLDVGVNRVPDPTTKKGYRLVGDVRFEDAKHVAGGVTPPPGGGGGAGEGRVGEESRGRWVVGHLKKKNKYHSDKSAFERIYLCDA